MGVPKVFFYGITSLHSVMIIDLLGQNLEGLFNLCSVRACGNAFCQFSHYAVEELFFENYSYAGDSARMNRLFAIGRVF